MKVNTNALVCCWGCIASANAWFAKGDFMAGVTFIVLGLAVLFTSFLERNQ